MARQYSDEHKLDTQIRDYLEQAPNLDSSLDLMQEEYSCRFIRYHLSSKRSNLLRHLNFSGLRVLEIGAGMGGLSRYLAENCEFLQVVEGTQTQFDALSVRLHDLSNWNGAVLNLDDFQTDEKFDVICLVGVVEYSPLLLETGVDKSTFDATIEKAYRMLKSGGALIVATENQLGLKYWNGTPDDHTNRMFDGITGYGLKPSPRSFSKHGLTDLLRRNGFTAIEEFYPFPDYKFPTAILHSSAFSLPPEVTSELACASLLEYDPATRQPIYPDYLATLELTRADLLQELSNSFLFVAFKDGNRHLRSSLLKQYYTDDIHAWYYGKGRAGKVLTQFKTTAEDTIVSKVALSNWKPTSNIHWEAVEEPLVKGTSMQELFERAAYHCDWTSFMKELTQFLEWLLTGKHYVRNNDFLPDAIWHNARKTEHGYELFDQEWKIPYHPQEHHELSDWILFRNVVNMVTINRYWSRDRPWNTLKDLYLQTARHFDIKTDYELCLHREATFQPGASGDTNTIPFQKNLHRVMTRQRHTTPFMTKPLDWIILNRYCIKFIPTLRWLQNFEICLRRLINR